MGNWKSEAIKRAAELVDDGHHPADAVREIMLDYRSEIEWDTEASLLNLLTQKQKKAWAEPPGMEQLRFNLNGNDISIPDTPVRFVDEDGEERFKPARHSTISERLDSNAARIQHHQSWIRRSEAEHQRETLQMEVLIGLGVDINMTWDQMRHTNTCCWRCGLGWRAGDPFEMGHCDRPQSQGGTEVSWEHRSCNRSAEDNPVSHPNFADDTDRGAA